MTKFVELQVYSLGLRDDPRPIVINVATIATMHEGLVKTGPNNVDSPIVYLQDIAGRERWIAGTLAGVMQTIRQAMEE